MNKRRVVVTGLGVIAPNGIGKNDFWHACTHGQSGVDKISSFDTDGFDCHIAGQVKNFNPSLYIPTQIVNKIDRFVHFGLSASSMAIEDSLLNLNQENMNKIGVIIGSGFGGFIFQEEQMLDAMLTGKSRLNPLCVPRITPNAVSSHIAITYGLLGPNLVITSSFASGTQAIGEAFRKIQHSEIDICITGGAEAPLTRFAFGACCASGVVSKRNDFPQEASRPFDRLRDGYVIAEGAGILILEELSHALKRNAPIYAEVKGYSANFSDIFESDIGNISNTINGALKDARLNSNSIDYINASASSTPA
ncbi:MAG: beta-ketoacyl-[acyl-carrier-protein] synthase family protein, partial [Candidatus Omnitrophota bacterium]